MPLYPLFYTPGIKILPLNKKMFYVRRVYLFRLAVPVLEGATCSLPPSSACFNLIRHILPLLLSLLVSLYNVRSPSCQTLLYVFFPFYALHLHCIDFVSLYVHLVANPLTDVMNYHFRLSLSSAQRILFLRRHISLIYLTTLFHFEL